MASVDPTLSPPNSPNSSSSSSYNFFTSNSPITKNTIRDIILQILVALIEPNMFRDPMGLAHEGIKQRRIAATIENFRVDSAGSTLIEASHVPGHVNGVIPGSANYLQLPADLLFYQYVKPLCQDKNGNPVNGYVGNYFCLDPQATPDNLGIYHLVLDPGTDQRIPRQHICIRLKKTPSLTIHSQAKKIVDNFSIPGEGHLVQGGAEQFFIGIKLNEVKDYLEIIIPASISSQEKDKILAISKRAGIPYIEVDEPTFRDMQGLSQQLAKQLPEEPPSPQTLSETLSLVLKAVQLDRCPQAIQLLHTVEAILDLPEHQTEKALVILLRSCLYATVGNAEEHPSPPLRDKFKEANSATIRKDILIILCSHFILARTEPSPQLAISALQRLLKRLSSNNSNLEYKIRIRLKILTLLELSKQFNRLYNSTTPYMLTRDDFNHLPTLAEDKIAASQQALTYIQEVFALEVFALDIHKHLHPQELIHFHSQCAYAKYRLGDNKGALDQLILCDTLLQELIANVQDIYWRSAKDELELLQLSIKLRLYLILAKMKKEDYPAQYQSVSPQKELIELSKKFEQFDPMLIKLMVEKLLAMDSSDYHITGWTDHGSLQFAGADLIKEIRKVVPVKFDLINKALTRSRSIVEKLDIPFLGLLFPCGISNDECNKFLAALKENTSLKSLALRKFASRAEDKQGNMILDTTNRLTNLLTTLDKAQQRRNGMELTYFSYDGARLSKDPNIKEQQMEAACQFIENNSSLLEFFPDLFDWDDEKFFRRFVTALKNHPTLQVLYAGIWEKNPNAGEILYEILKDREKPLKIVLHPNPLREGGNPNARKNNEWLQKLNAHWASQVISSPEQEDKGKENENVSRPRMRM